MPHRDSAPTRTLPSHPSLAQLRKQAKELLKSFKRAEQNAVTEVQLFERQLDPASFALTDAQRILARAYGFSSWTKLKDHVEGIDCQAFIAAAEAGDIDAVRQLAESRPELVDANVAEFHGSALHQVVLKRDAEMTRVLMEVGSDARRGIWPHRDATTAYAIAVDRQYDEIVEIIEQEERRRRKKLSSQGATVDSRTAEIHAAFRLRQPDDAIRILQNDLTLIGSCDVDGVAPLHIAAATHNPRAVAWLLDHGASVDSHDAEGNTALDHAALFAGWSANDRFFPFLENASVEPARFCETVQILRSRGAELTPRASVAIGDEHAVLQMMSQDQLKNNIHFYRGGLLAIAARVNRIGMVKLLLDLGFHPDEPASITEDGGRSWGFPLWFATLCGRHDIAEMLLTRGADVNAMVYACGDSLCIAQDTSDEQMRALLLKHGARMTVEHVVGAGDRETAAAILDGKIPAQSLNVPDPSHSDLAGQMLWSAASSDPAIVKICLPHIDWSVNDSSWHYVLIHCESPECLKLILQHGVDPDVAEEWGFTTLHHIATMAIEESKRLELASLLLDAGASLTKRDSLLQSTPLGWACRWQREDLVQLYLKSGADPIESDAEPWATPIAWASKCGCENIIDTLSSYGTK